MRNDQFPVRQDYGKKFPRTFVVGQRIHTTGDMNEYAQFLNRYGKMIYGVSENEPAGN